MKRILRAKTGKKNERGFSILEALVACVVMLIGVSGVMALFMVAAAKNAGQGDQATRCTEYAQDKIEQLMALQYTDQASLAAGSVTAPSGGPGLGGTAAGTVGSICPSPTTTACTTAPTANYVDYYNTTDAVDADGISSSRQCASCASSAQYMREWSITTTGSGTSAYKTITVYVQALFTADVAQSLAPSTTLIVNKGQY